MCCTVVVEQCFLCDLMHVSHALLSAFCCLQVSAAKEAGLIGRSAAELGLAVSQSSPQATDSNQGSYPTDSFEQQQYSQQYLQTCQMEGVYVDPAAAMQQQQEYAQAQQEGVFNTGEIPFAGSAVFAGSTEDVWAQFGTAAVPQASRTVQYPGALLAQHSLGFRGLVVATSRAQQQQQRQHWQQLVPCSSRSMTRPGCLRIWRCLPLPP
jgi:hypothetical protein